VIPNRKLLQLQAEWLTDARVRILRKAEIGRRKRVLDLGCGYGIIISELERRSSGYVVALDRELHVLPRVNISVCADARELPFRPESFDLVFSQNVLLWIHSITDVVESVRRILSRDGVWVLFEPDYGGMMEYPEQIGTRDLWLSVLPRLYADPMIGRKIPTMLLSHGFKVETELLPHLLTPDPVRFDFLSDLPLNEEERQKLEATRRASVGLEPTRQTCHLPYYLIIARPN
jgi:SAM-dependent methyltransferase